MLRMVCMEQRPYYEQCVWNIDLVVKSVSLTEAIISAVSVEQRPCCEKCVCVTAAVCVEQEAML